MLLGCIADDFTGAGDLANTLNKNGMRTRLILGPVGAEDILDYGDADAIVIALKSRSLPVSEAVEQSLSALSCLQIAGAVQYMYKYCSTFDSTQEGNIGPVAEALADALETKGVVVCPSFPANKRTVYQGHLFVGDKLLNESGMETHPLTPMFDSDIRRWLQKQCTTEVGHIAYDKVRSGVQYVQSGLLEYAKAGCRLVVVDAVSDDDLRNIGKALAEAIFTGGSAIALAVPDNFRDQGLLGKYESRLRPLHGPTVILAGSCSNMTMEQVATYSADHPAYVIDIPTLMDGQQVLEAAWAFIESNRNASPLVYSTASASDVATVQNKYGRDDVSLKTENLFGQLATRALEHGFQKIICAGGETSGAVTQALQIKSLEVGHEIASGVPALYSNDGTLALVLKSGNFGQSDFFSRAARILRWKMSNATKREQICRLGESIFARGLTHGSTGNISVRLEDGTILCTPTNISLGSLDPSKLSHIDTSGRLLSGDAPTKEVPLHSAMYQTREADNAVVHLHSTHSVAVSMLQDIDPHDVLPPMTAYYVMRVGKTALLPYFVPGSPHIGEAIKGLAGRYSAVLLANHGPVVSGRSLENACWAIEELEETAKLYLLLKDQKINLINI